MLPLGDIIRKHGVSFHCYADDTQLYISSRPDETHQIEKLTECIVDIKNWMTSNFLLLNSEKTEVLIIGYDHISPVLSTLHLVSIKHRIDFKILLMTYKALNG